MAERRAPAPRVVAFDHVLAAALDHEPWASNHIWESLAGRVAGYLRNQGAHEPEDLTSEVFLRVFDRLGQFSGDEVHFRAWVFTIAHRLLIDDARSRHRRPVTSAFPDEPDDRFVSDGDVEATVLTHAERDWADELLETLPHDQRTVVALRVTADLSIETVAHIMGKRVGAVKALQHRALAKLRQTCVPDVETTS